MIVPPGLRILLSMGLALLLSATQANAQSVFDEVEECDLLAAHPADPERVAEGVADDAIIPRLAVKACEAAVKEKPGELRFAYQLGRALLAANLPAKATEQLKRAADGNYAAAFAAQAEILLVGPEVDRWMQSIKTAPALAIAQETFLPLLATLHAKALKAGFTTSRPRIEAATFEPSLYTQPILGQIAKRDFAAARTASQQADTRAYLYTFVTNLMGQCGPVLNAQAVARLAAYRFGGAISAEQEDSPAVSIQPLVGEVDAQRFVRRHGCDGALPQIVLFLPLALYLERP